MREIRKLPECEEMVMMVVWDAKEAPDLEETMSRVNERYGKTWRPQTVSTFLARLKKKGYLSAYRKGRYTYYVPEVLKQEYRKMIVGKIVRNMYAGDSTELIEDLMQVMDGRV